MQASLPFAIIEELMPGSVFVLFSFLLGDSSSPLVMVSVTNYLFEEKTDLVIHQGSVGILSCEGRWGQKHSLTPYPLQTNIGLKQPRLGLRTHG